QFIHARSNRPAMSVGGQAADSQRALEKQRAPRERGALLYAGAKRPAVGSLLTGVHVLDAVALVLERGAVGTGQVGPAALLALVLRCGHVRRLALAELDVADRPDAGVVRDDERNVVGRDLPAMGREDRPTLPA